MADYKWIKFEGVNKREEDRITVTSTRAFGFPTKFSQDHDLKNFDYVTLFFDKEKMAVGFRFHSDKDEPHKYKLLKSNQGYGANAMAMSFFKQNNVDAHKYRGRYPYEKISDPALGEIYIIELKEHPVTNQPVKTEEGAPIQT
ncbi:MAG: hypothetical protein WAV40_04610 [Microgenomates group bacterium]